MLNISKVDSGIDLFLTDVAIIKGMFLRFRSDASNNDLNFIRRVSMEHMPMAVFVRKAISERHSFRITLLT